MTAYLVCMVDVRDAEVYAAYAAKTPDIIARHGGRFLARGGRVQTLEGEGFDGRFVILEFPDADAARTFYNSADYEAARAIRAPVSSGRFYLVEGV